MNSALLVFCLGKMSLYSLCDELVQGERQPNLEHGLLSVRIEI